jgi:deoxyribonuclease V
MKARPPIRQAGPSGSGVRVRLRHSFDVDFPEARRLQERLRTRVIEADPGGRIERVAGVDVSFDRRSPVLFAAVVVLDARSGAVLERSWARRRTRFPYVPGYLSFRELPPLLAAFEKLREPPDLVIVDGHGRAHPRRFGIACHLGVILDLPTLGCAKSRLVGRHREPGPRRGATTQLRDGDDVIGAVLRTREGVKPVFVSVGHRMTLPLARSFVLRLARRYRLPEPIREAHQEVNRQRRRARGEA